MKKLFAAMMALIMVLSLLPAAAMAEEAEELTPVEVAEVMFDEPVAGGAVPAVEVPEDAPYTVSAAWSDDATGDPVTVLEDGQRYQLLIKVIAAEGYAFDWDTVAIVNGEEASNYWYNEETGELEIWDTVSFKQPIEEVEILMDEPVAGADLPVPSVPEGALYTIDSVVWYDQITGEEVTALEEGGLYEVVITAVVPEGYEISEEVQLLFNGEADYDYASRSWEDVSIGVYYNFCEKIEMVSVELEYEPEVGKAAPAPVVPEDANYGVESYDWYDLVTGETVEIFADGHRYELEIELKAKDGYAFSGEVIVNVCGEEWIDGSDSNVMHVRHSISFCEAIEGISVTYEEPAVGAAVPAVSIPEDADYTLEEFEWMDWDSNEIVTAFEDGRAYQLRVGLQPKEGFEFDEELIPVANGEEPYGYWVSADYAEIFVKVSFKKIIKEVDLPAMPEELKAGDKLELDLGEGNDKYSVEVIWQAMDDQLEDAEVGETAEAGKNYTCLLVATPAEGYEFAEDVVVTVGGKKVETALAAVGTDYIVVGKLYMLGELQMIEKVDLTVTMPEEGEEAGQVSIDSDAPFTLDEEELIWAFSDTDDMEEADFGKAKKGQYAWFVANLLAKDGYLFSPEVKYYVNGELVETEALGLYATGVSIYSATEVAVVVNMGQVGAEKEPSEEKAPLTGDEGVAIYGVLAVVALCGTAVLVFDRKRRTV